MPAMPRMETRRARRSRAVAWSSSLSRRSSSSRPDERRLEAGRPAVPAPPGDDPHRPPGRDRQRLAAQLLVLDRLVDDRRLGRPDGRLAHEDGARRGATDWRREAVLTRSPATIPWPSAARVTAASPVITAPRTATVEPSGVRRWLTASSRSTAARTARSASSSRATGVPQTAITASPMNFSMVPAVAPDPLAGQREVAVEELADRLGVAVVGQGGEADEVGEQDADDPPLRRARRPPPGSPGPAWRAGGRRASRHDAGAGRRQDGAACPTEPVAGLGGVPQSGMPRRARCRTSGRTAGPPGSPFRSARRSSTRPGVAHV